MTLRKELEDRGFLYQFTDEKLFDLYEKWWQNFYLWIDPSAESLQLWNLCAIMAAVILMKYGNKCYFLIWGATWMIWDPSWKSEERNFLWLEKLRNNEKNIYQQVVDFMNSLKKNYWLELQHDMVNNYDIYKDMTVLDFWAEVGKYITVNSMMNKESVKPRLTDPDKSITYTEFSYMLIQGYDFTKLNQDYKVNLQLWWSDQRWNITTWIEITRKKLDTEVYGLTIPIITDAAGKKFGKSEWNALWLDPKKNSPYKIYQYFLNTADDDVEKFLKILTLLDLEEISSIVEEHKKDTSKREWQIKLASYVVELIFWNTALKQVQTITQILFWTEDKLDLISNCNMDDLLALQQATGGITLSKSDFGEEQRILDLCTQTWISGSNWEAKKLIQAWSIYCNEEKITDIQSTIKISDIKNNSILLRKWKKVNKLVIVD